ncbi:hypothetical protein BCY86_00390 [Pajaroellobacter abortibovis]|uniref:Uncharacterized protein n=2 Tax=Pajaroellobacter abortibovis TaxID=1882918 RepID=A0A1L6MUW7_9BACT|nr:hypothetical protein BCY86_00390 [Pajaroellobacter abortibovis]
MKIDIPYAHLVFASPRKLPSPGSLQGRVVVLDIAFSSEIGGGGFEKVTRPFIEGLGERLIGWIDHHDHCMHSTYAGNPRFVLAGKAQYGACPAMVTPQVIASVGTADTIVCHTDFDGLCSAAKWIRGGEEPYPGADRDAYAIDTRTGTPSAIGQRFDHALRVRTRDQALFGIVVRHLATGLEDSALWKPIDEACAEWDSIEKNTQKIAHQYKTSSLPMSNSTHIPPACRHFAFIDMTLMKERYDKTLLLLLGQEQAPIAMMLTRDTLVLSARYDSGIDFVRALGFSGGMPTLISIPRKQAAWAVVQLGMEPFEVQRFFEKYPL